MSSEEVVEDVQVQSVLDPDNLRAAADHPAKKLMDFEHGVRHGSILHPPVAVPPPPFGLLGVTLSASLHDRFLACWEYFGASWEGFEASYGLKISWEGFRASCEGLNNSWNQLKGPPNKVEGPPNKVEEPQS